MNDFMRLSQILSKMKDVPQSAWTIVPDKSYPTGVQCMVFGCPDGNGPYLQALFDRRGDLVSADVVDQSGNTCRCKWCLPKRRRKNAHRR